MISKATYKIFAIIFGALFLITLALLITYAFSVQGEFKRGMDAAKTLSDAQDYFLGGDDPHLATITRNDGSRVSLAPSAYSVNVKTVDGSGGTLGSVRTLGFSKTTQQNIVGLQYLAESGQHETAFVDPNERTFVRLDDKAFGALDTVEFNGRDPYLDTSYTITTNVPRDDCSDVVQEALDLYGGDNYFGGLVTECNKTGGVSVSQIFVNGEVAHSFNSIQLTRLPGGLEAPMGYEPSVWSQLIGVSPSLDRAYFEVLDKVFSIDSDGVVQETEFPNDIVTIIYE